MLTGTPTGSIFSPYDTSKDFINCWMWLAYRIFSRIHQHKDTIWLPSIAVKTSAKLILSKLAVMWEIVGTACFGLVIKYWGSIEKNIQ